MTDGRKRFPISVWGALAVATAFAVWQVWSLRWVTDDAFISFRYADNLCRGLGLVFNAGERVEGYTNFLWTLLMAGGIRLGVDPVSWSAGLGVLAYLLTAACWAGISWRLWNRNPTGPYLPLAALALLVQHDQHIFATCGLETSWVTLFVTLAFAALLFAQRGRDYYLAGAALTVAALSRPDALIFLMAVAVFTMFTSADRLRSVARLLLFPVLIYLPYWIWRYTYYGYPFPNTYYAKSGGLAYYEQGIQYLWMYVKTYYVFALVPVAVVLLWLRSRNSTKGESQSSDARTAWLLVAFMVPFTLYVVRVGGDFMFGRFLLPVAGFGFFALECALRRLRFGTVWTWSIALLLVVLVWARQDLFKSALIVNGVADEPACYPAAWHENAKTSGMKMRSLFEGRDVRVAFSGRYAMWVYYARPATAIEAETGLTDTTIAHRFLLSRGRPGHEKPATLKYLQRRETHFLFRPPFESDHPLDRLRFVRFYDLEALMLTYDQALLDAWRGNTDVSFTDYPQLLDRIIADSAVIASHEYVEMLAFSEGYYFGRQPDTTRRSALERLAAR